ncbi:MAG: pitrilysin family protein [Acidobacteria bacterium]|nr:pitrilysin family protein [Acidobacteriota bacterium]
MAASRPSSAPEARSGTHTGPEKETPEFISVPGTGVPVIHFRLLIRAGAAEDPPGREGLASFTAKLLRRGTRSLDRDCFDDALDQIAAVLETRVQREYTVIQGITLKRNLDEFYRILVDMLLEPRFDPRELEKLKADQIDAVEAVRQSDEALGREVFFQEMFRDHPYGHLSVGSLSSIRSITPEDVRNFHAEHYVRAKLIVGLAGAIEPELEERLRGDLEKMPAGKMERSPRTEAELSGRRVVLVEKEGRTQTHLRIGHPIPVTRAHADYTALMLANTQLGRHRNSMGRLYQAVREQRGLSYGAYSYIGHFLGTPGPTTSSPPDLARGNQAFHMWIYPRSENAAFVLKLAIREMEELKRAGVPDDRFDDVRDFTRNSFAFDIETPARRLAMELDDRIYGVRDFARRFPDEVSKITRAEVNGAAARHLRPQDLLIVAVVPDAGKLKGQILSEDAPLIYPSGVDATPLAPDDAQVRAVKLDVDPGSIKILKANDLFR